MKAKLFESENLSDPRDGMDSQRHGQALFNNALDAILMVDKGMRFVDANPAACALTGYSRKELLQLRIQDVTPVPNHELLRAMWRELLSAGKLAGDYTFLRKDGTAVIAEFRAVANIVPGLHMAILHDISAHKFAEGLMREARARTESILASVTDTHIMFDYQWRYLYVNEAAVQAMGRPREQILGCTLWELYPDIVGTKLENQYRLAMEERVPVTFDFHYLTTDTWWENRFYPAPEGLAVFATNITERKRAEERLAYHTLLLENVHDAIVAADEHFILTAWNHAAEEMYGWKAAEVIGHDIREVVRSEYPEAQRKDAIQILADTGYFSTEAIHRRRDGGRFWIEGNIIALKNASGQVTGYIYAFHDITERKRAEERLREYEKVVQSLEEMIVVVNREYRYVIANQAFLNYRGLDREQTVGHLISEILDKDVFEKAIKKKLDECFQGKVVKYELKYTYAELGERDLFISYFPIEGPTGIDRVVCILQDITERKQAEAERGSLFEELSQSHEQLRALSIRLLEVEEAERKRLAREIHDDISQSLTALMMQLGTAKNLLPKSVKATQTILGQTEELVEKTLERTRSMIADLRPQVLDDLGLVPALRRLGDELQKSTGAAVKIKTSRLPKRLPMLIEVALFRIVQEALANIHKHAQAHHVVISLAKEAEQVVLFVQDDGIGFEKQTLRSRAKGNIVMQGGWVIPAGHFGLMGIQERITQLGGTLEVTSAPGQGTILQVELPLRVEDLVL